MPHECSAVRECWCCGEERPHHGRGLCCRCYDRWRRRGFTGPGPGPEFLPALTRARDHLTVLTSAMTNPQAGMAIGVDKRTVQRWRKALREAS